MICPQCSTEYEDGPSACPTCAVPAPIEDLQETMEYEGDINFDVLIRSGFTNPIAIGLAKSLLNEARIPFFTMDQSPAPRQESGNFLGWWTVRVQSEREAEAREILENVEAMK